MKRKTEHIDLPCLSVLDLPKLPMCRMVSLTYDVRIRQRSQTTRSKWCNANWLSNVNAREAHLYNIFSAAWYPRKKYEHVYALWKTHNMIVQLECDIRSNFVACTTVNTQQRKCASFILLFNIRLCKKSLHMRKVKSKHSFTIVRQISQLTVLTVTRCIRLITFMIKPLCNVRKYLVDRHLQHKHEMPPTKKELIPNRDN